MVLAHALGKSVAEIGGMDLDELALWLAWFTDYNPALRDDLRAGVIASTVANSALFSKGNHKPEDFMPNLKTATKPRSEEEMEKVMIAWCVNAGGEVRTEKKP